MKIMLLSMLVFGGGVIGPLPMHANEGLSAFDSAPDLLLQSKKLAFRARKKSTNPSNKKIIREFVPGPTEPAQEVPLSQNENQPRHKAKSEEDAYGELFQQGVNTDGAEEGASSNGSGEDVPIP